MNVQLDIIAGTLINGSIIHLYTRYGINEDLLDLAHPLGIFVNTSGKARAQIPHLPLGHDSSPCGR
jgi:hypothetical protein